MDNFSPQFYGPDTFDTWISSPSQVTLKKCFSPVLYESYEYLFPFLAYRLVHRGSGLLPYSSAHTLETEVKESKENFISRILWFIQFDSFFRTPL